MPPTVDVVSSYVITKLQLKELRQIYFAFAVYIAFKIAYHFFLYPRLFSPIRSLPGPPVRVDPILGHFADVIFGEPGVPQGNWVQKYGPVVKTVGPLGQERILFTKAEALHKILGSDWTAYPRPEFLRNTLGLVAGYGLLTVTGNEHRQMRKAMNPAFSIANLTAQTDMYYDSIEGLIDILMSEISDEKDPSQGKKFYMYEWMSKATLDIICEAAFGYKADSLHNPDNELAVAYEKLNNLQSQWNMSWLAILLSIPGGPRFFNSEWIYRHKHWFEKISLFAPVSTLMESMYKIKAISAQMLKEKMADNVGISADDTAAKKDIMSLLVRARLSEEGKGQGYSMNDRAMMEQVLTFLGAGHETTASGLAWTFWLLAKDKNVQDKLRAEVTPIVLENPRPDYRTLKEMQYLDCVVMESLRVLPPVPITLRQAGVTQYVDGVLVPKNTILYIAIRMVNTWKEVWGEDAEEFKPERWLDLPKDYSPTFSLLSFIAGPHACIGRTMSVLEMKAVVALLVTHFEFDPAYDGQRPIPTHAITMKPADNMPLRVRNVTERKN